mgnify:CR=1 FL=1
MIVVQISNQGNLNVRSINNRINLIGCFTVWINTPSATYITILFRPTMNLSWPYRMSVSRYRVNTDILLSIKPFCFQCEFNTTPGCCRGAEFIIARG